MRLLGLSLDDTSAAALMDGDRFAACASEERFSRLKRDEGFPRQAIDYCLKAAGARAGELDAVVVASTRWDFWRWLCRYWSRFSIDDLVREQDEYWRPLLYGGKKPDWPALFADKRDFAQFPGRWVDLASRLGPDVPMTPQDQALADAFLDQTLADQLGVPRERVLRVDRHAALEAYAYWASPFRGRGTGVLVLDAAPFGPAASAAAPLKFGLARLCAADASQFRLARLMRDVTLMLGLPPRDHDPVVMGLAARVPEERWKPVYRVFARRFAVRGHEFVSLRPMRDTYFHFLDELRGFPDDAVAAGVQRFVEDQAAEWVGRVSRGNELSRLAIAGSLSMNHRVMARVAALKSVKDVFVPPAAGTGAAALGACLQLATVRFGVVPRPLEDACLGPDAARADIEACVAELRAAGKRYEIVPDAPPQRVARLLAGGAIVGRCAGRAEFGSRALGNRSILADPRNLRIGPFIAAKIKRRDTTAQFSPTILASAAGRYLDNPKRLGSPFMTLAFKAKARAQRDLAAAVDPDERTLRPQLLETGANPGFEALIRAFQKITGVPALLNTSLNAGGEPVALTAKDAARVFRETNLDYLLLGTTLVGKRNAVLRRGR